MQRKLTQAAAEKIAPPPPGAKRVEVFDTMCPGLALRVSHTGNRSWVCFYKVKGSAQQRRATIGRLHVYTLLEAREAANAIRRDAARGINPGCQPPDVCLIEFSSSSHNDQPERH